MYDLETSAENRHASFLTICQKVLKNTIIRHYSMFKKKICFQNIPAESELYFSTITPTLNKLPNVTASLQYSYSTLYPIRF